MTQPHFLPSSHLAPSLGERIGILLSRQDLRQWFCLLCLLQWAIQSQSIITADQIWADEIAKRMLAGGSYRTAFFENNPPMIFFLHLPVHRLATALHLSGTRLWDLAVLAMMLSSYFWVSRLLQRYFADQPALVKAYQGMLLVGLGILPFINFGQREQVMLCLSLPYFFYHLGKFCRGISVESPGQSSISAKEQIAIGLCAGIGLSFKPYFFFPVVLLETMAYVSPANPTVRKVNWPLWSIMVVQLAYLVSIAVVTPEYYTDVFPFAAGIYARYATFPRYTMLLLEPMLFILPLMAVGIFLVAQRHVYSRAIVHGLGLSTGFLLSFITQGKAFDYYAIPLLAAAFITLAPVGLGLVEIHRKQLSKSYPAICLGILTVLALYPGLHGIPLKVVNNLRCRHHPYCEANLVRLIRQHHPTIHSFYIATHSIPMTMSNMYMSGLPYASRFPNNWLVLALSQPQYAGLRKKIRGMMVDDIVKQQPSLILVDKCDTQAFGFRKFTFDHLAFLKESKRFRQAWSDYQPIDHGNPYRRCIKAYLRTTT